MTTLSIPTTSALPSTQLVPSTHPAVHRTLLRLSRQSMISLVLDWLDERNQENTAPYLLSSDDEDNDENDDDLYPPASSLAALREIYTDLQGRKGGKRDVVDRAIEGDWRDGISLYQLAMADMQYLYDHPSSQKWNALKITRLTNDQEKTSPSIPRFHPATFLRNLQQEVLPDVKAHYNLDRHATLPLLILRVFIVESPYNTSLALQSVNQNSILDSNKTFYVAFPDSSPHVFVSATFNAQSSSRGPSSNNKSLRRLILEGIPKAFSKPRERYTLQSTSLSAKNLEALVEKRGGGRTSAAGGGWSVYAEEKHGKDNPLNTQLPTPEASILDDVESNTKEEEKGLKRKREEAHDVVKRRRLVAQGRFGNTAKADDGKGIERLDIRVEDLFPEADAAEEEDLNLDDSARDRNSKRKGRRSSISIELDKAEEDDVQADGWRPDVRITLHGSHVFAGIRDLIEAGIVEGEKMPGWMTGEEGVSLGVVRDGRIRGFKGTGV
ncbi:CHL4-domain-containing protein [Mollisia scopiformis]|uniref:CHL4-domain-containing protein n=1 Tax=Mollisia scopiformis TaxID=149040 RepID=A0A132B2M8_MOLSC|nr:CHL4-domain-containing protein [Mollisia scopiformis]KUJ06581.1 CHL4-domain-containing protein [Mollisia scopiformis]